MQYLLMIYLNEAEFGKMDAAARKNLTAALCYLIAIPTAYFSTWGSLAITLGVSILFVRPSPWPIFTRRSRPAPETTETF